MSSGSHSHASGPTDDSRSVFIHQYDDPSHFLSVVSPSLTLEYETSAVVILAHAQKCIADPRPRDDFWLTVWSTSSPRSRPALELILMCGSWLLGNYPIFLWAPPNAEPKSDATCRLVESLINRVSDERVFAVFGPTNVTRAFTKQWSEVTGIHINPNPFYDAYLARCTKDTLRQGRSRLPLPQGHNTRLATMEDLERVAKLCLESADHSPPYNLNKEQATLEARELIVTQQVWVYDASSAGIACICATARHSRRASVISKVYTLDSFRGKGFAERLVRHVVEHLFSKGRETVVLYVGKNNSARRVYDRVGFSGIGDQAKNSDDREDWLEIGFHIPITGRW